MTRAENFRIAAVGGLADVIEQVRQWHDGKRFGFAREDEAWDELIHNAQDDPHHSGQNRYGPDCTCHHCRPNRKYK